MFLILLAFPAALAASPDLTLDQFVASYDEDTDTVAVQITAKNTGDA